jgi:hypothetical protein
MIPAPSPRRRARIQADSRAVSTSGDAGCETPVAYIVDFRPLACSVMPARSVRARWWSVRSPPDDNSVAPRLPGYRARGEKSITVVPHVTRDTGARSMRCQVRAVAMISVSTMIQPDARRISARTTIQTPRVTHARVRSIPPGGQTKAVKQGLWRTLLPRRSWKRSQHGRGAPRSQHQFFVSKSSIDNSL